MSNIPKCRLETYWASKEVLHVQNPKMSFGNIQGLTKRFFKTTLFYGPMAPGAHRAHILLLNIFIYLFNIYFYLIVLPIELPIVLPIELPIDLPIVLPIELLIELPVCAGLCFPT